MSKQTILDVIHLMYQVPLNSLEEHTIYIVRMLGCYLIAIAVMPGIAARNPAENRAIIWAMLFGSCFVGSSASPYVERFHRDWGISYGFLWAGAAVVFLIAYSSYR